MEKIKIGDVCDILNGYAFKSENYVDSGIRIIRISNVQKGYIEDSTPAFYSFDTMGLSKFMLEEGDLLMSLTGNVGRVAILEKELLPAALNQRVACLRLKSNKITKSYLFHFLNSNFFEQQCIMASNGVAQKNMSTEWLKDYEIPLYTPNQQEEIVTVLNAAQSILSSRRQQLQKLDELIKARFVELFGDPRINPNKYPVCQLSDYIVFLTSGSRGWAQYCADDGTEWFITIKNVKDCHIETDNMQPINAPNNAEAKRTRVQEGDLLISITADLGRTGVVTKEIAEHGAYINQHLTCIRLKQDVLNPLYVAYFMESPAGKEQFESKNQSAVKAGLNFNSINSLRLMIPPLDDQNAFIDFIKQTDKSKAVIQKALDEAQLLFDSLMQKYFG
ncbi:MAG: restriction endonuclease subunit S [Oscillospiraceae bacterium]|jgi:hypothetical protein